MKATHAVCAAWMGFMLSTTPAAAQWTRYPTPGIPRTQDGQPNLTAPVPKTADGKPDLSGIWKVGTGKYLENLAADGVEVPMTAWAMKLYQERRENNSKDRPSGHCLPHGLTDFDAHFTPKKIIQTPAVVALLFEVFHTYRQIFTDGRPLPKDPDPAWFGYSVGTWDGDTLVVNTIGITEKTWLDDNGHPHSDQLHVTERFHRRDFGHMQVRLTIDDPKAYSKPWSVEIPWELYPDTELLDWVCENNKDPGLMVGK